jgi:hypothetical protein
MGGPHCSGDRAMDLRLEIRDWDLWELRVRLRDMVTVHRNGFQIEIGDLRERLVFRTKPECIRKQRTSENVITIKDWDTPGQGPPPGGGTSAWVPSGSVRRATSRILGCVRPLDRTNGTRRQCAPPKRDQAGVSHWPDSAERKTASITAMFFIASSTETGASPPSRTALENASP